ncbi:MAG: hypothetical protein JO067_09065 [Cupriavidus sp.]|nr:hypothetical protein [Cupriavidus sp.]
MKTFLLLCAALVASMAAHAETPGGVAAPLGVELGKTKCARMTPGPNRTRTGTSPWAGGDTLEIRNLERFKLPGLTKATVNCDNQDTVALVTLNFDRSAMDDVVRKLDARYESKRKTDASAQNGYAEWAAANGSIEMLYARDGKGLVVAYWAKGAKAKYFSYSSTRDKQQSAPASPQGQL